MRGAAAVYMAGAMIAAVAATGLVFDVGRLYNAQRELQRAANLAALDAATLAGGCRGNLDGALTGDPLGVATAEAQASLARNNVSATYLAAGAVKLGRLDNVGGVRSFVALSGDDAGERTAVQVTLTRPAPSRILPLTPGGMMQATVAANLRPEVSFRVGSGLAALNGGVLNDLLGGLLGGSVSLTVAQWDGLLNTNVKLGDLAAAAGAGSVNDFLTAQTTLPAALNDILNGLGNGQSGTVRGALTLLQGAASNARTVIPGNVVEGPLGLDGSGQDALVNVGDLVAGLAMSANGTNALNVPLHTALGNATITIIESPKAAVALAGDTSTYASTSQAKVDVKLSVPNINLSILGTGVTLSSVQLPLEIRAAKATAQLDEVQCARRGQPHHDVTLATRTSAVDVGIGTFTTPIDAPSPAIAPATLANVQVRVLGIVVASAKLTAGIYAGLGSNSATDVGFLSPYPSPLQSASTDLSDAVDGLVGDLTTSLSQPNGLKLTVTAGTLPVSVNAGALVGPLLSALGPLLNIVGSSLEPVLSLLGVTVGNAQVQVVSLEPVQGNRHTEDEDLSLQAFLFAH